MRKLMLLVMPRVLWSFFAKILNPLYDKHLLKLEGKYPLLIGRAVRYSIRIPIEVLEQKSGYVFNA